MTGVFKPHNGRSFFITKRFQLLQPAHGKWALTVIGRLLTNKTTLQRYLCSRQYHLRHQQIRRKQVQSIARFVVSRTIACWDDP